MLRKSFRCESQTVIPTLGGVYLLSQFHIPVVEPRQDNWRWETVDDKILYYLIRKYNQIINRLVLLCSLMPITIIVYLDKGLFFARHVVCACSAFGLFDPNTTCSCKHCWQPVWNTRPNRNWQGIWATVKSNKQKLKISVIPVLKLSG